MKRLTAWENSDGKATVEFLPDGDNGNAYDFDSQEEAIEQIPTLEDV